MDDYSTRPSGIILFATALVFAASAAACVYTAYLAWASEQTKSWPRTAGEIKKSHLEEPPIPGTAEYLPMIEYAYEVDGQTHRGEAVRMRNVGNKKRHKAEAVLAKYPVGATPWIYYNPDDPTEAYLEVGADLTDFAAPVIFALTTVLFGTIFATRLRQRGAFPADDALAMID
jgi:hypothetical protein